MYSGEVEIPINPGFRTIPVVIDAALGNNTVITVTWSLSVTISVVVNGPDETVIDDSSSEYYMDSTTKIITINLPEAQVKFSIY